jgi:hypothetical protein
MGYRSDVAYTVRFKLDVTHRGPREKDDHDANNAQSFFTFLAEIKCDPLASSVLDEVTVLESRQEINFSCESTKWYDAYPEVRAHERIIDIANEWCNDPDNNSGIWYTFVRLGEEIDDNEYRQNCGTGVMSDYEAVSISRQIITDWD